MSRDGASIREAAESWVNSFNAYPYDMMKLISDADIDILHEVTEPSRCDRVYVYEIPEGCEKHYGEIVSCEEDDLYKIELDDGTEVTVEKDEFEVERDSWLPMWGWMWQFGDSADVYWLEELDGIKIMSECGFRVYEHEELGYFFGIDGAGYDFYEDHWIPLYKKRGLRWHDERVERGEYFIKDYRKVELYERLLHLVESETEEIGVLREKLKGVGFTDKELDYEGYTIEGGE